MNTRVRRRRVLAVALAALLLPIVAGCAASTQPSASAPAPVASTQPSASAPAPVASASPSGAFGGSVNYQMDGASVTTEVDAVANGESVSGTAVSKLGTGTHTVKVECAATDGDTWAIAGTTQETTVPDEKAGDWSAVIVKDGSPQKIAIWLSDDKAEGIDCSAWLAGIGISGIDPDSPVESGALVAPPAP